jgi:hypothetical protein
MIAMCALLPVLAGVRALLLRIRARICGNMSNRLKLSKK